MRCLYCGKHLALFRKLTGGGEFCSEAHRRSYQDEYNRLALSRLLQSQAPAEEEPEPEPKLPPPSQKLKMRAGSVLGLDEMETSPRAVVPSGSAILPAAEGRRSLPAPAEAAFDVPDAKRRAGFAVATLTGLAGAIRTRAAVEPCPGVEVMAIAEHTPGAMTAAMGNTLKRCLRLNVSGARSVVASPRGDSTEFVSVAKPGVVEWSPAAVSRFVLPRAVSARLAMAGHAGCPAGVRHKLFHAASIARALHVPETPAQAGERTLAAARPATLALAAASPDEAALFAADLARFGLSWGFRDTLGTGFVAGLRLGVEQIRFEVGEDPDASQANLDDSVEEEIGEPQDQMLPHQFIAAVQGAALQEPEEVETVTPPVVEAQAEDDVKAVAAAERMCGWRPVALTPASVNTRQRLMQTFHAIGVANATPVQPGFAMLPLRPKFVLRPAASANEPEPEPEPVAATARVAGETTVHEEPAAAVAVAETDAKQPSAEDGMYTATLEFLDQYEKKRSGFSKLLGKIGIGCLLIAAGSAATHVGRLL